MASFLNATCSRAVWFACIVIIEILTCGAVMGQQPVFNTWTDGDSTFAFVDAAKTRRVEVDSMVRLTSTLATSSEVDSFLLQLSGIDAVFDQVNKAVVVDVSGVEGLGLYLVTDASDGRVFTIRSDGVEVTEIRGDPGTPEELLGPSAARAFRDPIDIKILVTDRGSNRVLRFDLTTKSLEYVYPPSEQGFEQLNEPAAAVPVPGRPEIVICDTRNNRILLIDTATSATVWTVGPAIPGDVTLNDPVDVEWTGVSEDEILITDRGNHRVLRFNQTNGAVVWQFGKTGIAALTDSTLNRPTDAQLLANGNVLIADAGNERLIEVDQEGRIVRPFLQTLPDLRSAFRLDDGRTLVISDNELIRLGFSTQIVESGIGTGKLNLVHDLRRQASFETLRWQLLEQPAGTGVRFQLRSAVDFADLAIAEFVGPTGPGSYYTTSPAAINPVHNGSRFYDFRVELSTNSFLETPVLDQVSLDYRFFRSDSTGVITSSLIQDSSDVIISRWEVLTFNTVIPGDPTVRDDVPLVINILEAGTDRRLVTLTANQNTSENNINLAQFDVLRNEQALRLQAVLQTNNSSVSPVLDDWSISWRRTVPENASISFTDNLGLPTEVVRTDSLATLGENPPRNVFIALIDQNILAVRDTVTVTVSAALSGDIQMVTLERQGTGIYSFPVGIPAVITNTATAANNRLEVFDRDTLIVRYVDPFSPEDTATDRALVLEFTSGRLQVENHTGFVFTGNEEVTFSDSLYLRISDETDRDFSSAQDTIFASLLDRDTNDSDQVMLVEVPDAGGRFTTGNFFSVRGIPLFSAQNGIRNDGRLQTLPNNEIIARYVDNVTLEVPLQVEPDTTDGDGVSGPGAFNFQIAPNPYRSGSSAMLRMRMEANSGSLRLIKVEIYNVGGERVRTLDGATLLMDRGIDIPRQNRSTSRTQWWDLRSGSSSGPLVSSGTYWARFSAVFTGESGTPEDVTSLRKFIVIQ